MRLRVTGAEGAQPAITAAWSTDPAASTERLRGELLAAVQRHREAERRVGRPPATVTVEFALEGAEGWHPVLAAADLAPVTVDSPFAADWPALIERLRLAYRHGLARRRLRQRTRARRGKQPHPIE